MIYVLIGMLGLGCLGYLILGEKSGVEREIERKMKLGMELQRRGKLREYGELMKEIEELEKKWLRSLLKLVTLLITEIVTMV